MPLPPLCVRLALLARVGFGVSPNRSMVGSLVAVAVPAAGGVSGFYLPTARARPSPVSDCGVGQASVVWRTPCGLVTGNSTGMTSADAVLPVIVK